MTKNIFEVNNEEKSRILNLHETATKNQYLTEDTENLDSIFLLPPTKEEIRYGKDIIITMNKKGTPYQTLNVPDRIKKRLESVHEEFMNNKNPSDFTFGIIGRYFKKHTEIFVPEY